LVRWRTRLHNAKLIRRVLQWEAMRVTPPDHLLDTFRELRPRVVVSTHPMMTSDYEVVMTARRLGIQTLGVVKSWDNLGKGLSAQPHLLSVWNPVNKEEAVRLRGYQKNEVEINGAVSFDPYYDPGFLDTREEFLRSLGLDPQRPVVTYATAGLYQREYYGRDETFIADDLLRMFAETPALKGAQLVIRLHPTSRLEDFWRFWGREGIAFSFAAYLPAIGWCPLAADVRHQTNLLKHSDVIVTTGSSWGIEAAIFDTPTVCPVYSDIQPEHASAQFDRFTLARHYKPLVVNKWIPVTRSYEETQCELEAAITQPGRLAPGRKAIVENYVYHRDAGSAHRVAAWIVAQARQAKDGKLRGL
jgi:hypothetical protein